MSPEEASDTYLKGTSTALQEYIKETNAAAISTDDFTVKVKQSKIETIARDKSLRTTREIIHTYNNDLETLGLSEEQFATGVSNGNANLGKYLTTVDKGSASTVKYVLSLIKAKVATIGMQVATMALNMAITMGISALLSLGISVISDLIHREENLIKKSEEAANAIKEISDGFKTSSDKIKDIGKRFAELSQGIDQLTGKNVSLTTDEYEEFLDLSNQLAEIFPTLSRQYDENGNAIVDLNGDVNTITNSLESLLEVERQIANQKIVDNLPDLYKGIKTKSKNYKDEIEDYKSRREELQSFINKLSDGNFEDSFNKIIQGNILSIEGNGKSLEELNKITSDYLNVLDELGIKYSYLYADYDGIDTPKTYYYEIPEWQGLSEEEIQAQKDKIKAGFRDIAGTYQDEINGLNQRIESTENNNKANWSGLLSGITSWLSTQDSYSAMSDEMRSVVQSMINNIDFGNLKYNSWEELQNYLSDNIISVVANATPNIQSAFSKLFTLSPETYEGSYNDFIDEIEKTINKIAENTGLDFDAILNLSGLDEVVTSAQDKIKKVQSTFANSDLVQKNSWTVAQREINAFNDWFNGLSIQEQDLVYEIAVDKETAEYNLNEWKNALADYSNYKEKTDFDIDIKAETEGLEKLNTALAESASATGLASDSVAELKKRYGDLEGFDYSKLFEETTQGIHLNREALEELEEAYEKQNKAKYEDKLNALKDKYNDLTTKIENCTNAQEMASLYTERANVLTQIEDTSRLASEYYGLTSAYNKWLQAKSSPDEKDTYEDIGNSYEDIQKSIEQGWSNTDDVNKYLDFVLAAEKRTGDNVADFKKLSETIKGTKFKITDFFMYDDDDNITSDGLFNFLKAVNQKLGDEYVQIGKDGSYAFDFTGEKLKKVTEELGLSEDAVRMFEKALIDAGMTVKFDPLIENFELMKTTVEKSEDKLKELGKTDYDFDFTTTNLGEIDEQIKVASDLLDKFRNKDGTINTKIEGADEAVNILSTLLYIKEDLTKPAIMSVDTSKMSEADKKIANGIDSLKRFVELSSQLKVQKKLGIDTSETEADLKTVANQIAGLDKDTKVALHIDEDTLNTELNNIGKVDLKTGVSIPQSSIDSVNATISSIKPKDITLSTNQKDVTDKLQTVENFVIEDKEFKVTVQDYASGVLKSLNDSELKSKTQTIYKNIIVTETASAQGTAHSRGSWGTPNSGTALGGELGQELVVRNGKFFTIGEDSAELFHYKKGDIIFNAEQTRQILKNGKITNGAKRGVAYAEGNAFDTGTPTRPRDNYGSSTSVSSSSSGSGSSSSSGHRTSQTNSNNNTKTGEEAEKALDKFNKYTEKLFDWIEIRLDRLQRKTDKYLDTAEKKVDSGKFDSAKKQYQNALSSISKQIKANESGKGKYKSQANSILRKAVSDGLISSESASNIKTKVADGTINISQYGEKMRTVIQEYEKWYLYMPLCTVMYIENFT